MTANIRAKLAVRLLPFLSVVAVALSCLIGSIIDSKCLKLMLKSPSKVIEVFARFFYYRSCAEPQLLSFRIRGEILPPGGNVW